MEYFNEVFKDEKFSDFNPVGCGYSEYSPNDALDFRDNEYMLIHYIVAGAGKLYINNKSYNVKAGQIFIVPKGTKAKCIADKDSLCTYIWISFDGDLSKRFESLPSVLAFKSNLFFEILNIQNMSSLKKEYLAQLIFKLYIELFQKDFHIDHVKAIKNYIDLNYMRNETTVDTIAKNLNLNRSYISRIFSQKQGISIKNYLIYVRMERAKELLSRGVSVQNVSKLVGYSDQFQFSKAFKLATGEPPIKYKGVKVSEK